MTDEVFLNILTHFSKVTINIRIGIPQDSNSLRTQICIPLRIFFQAILFIVLRAIQFYNHLGRGNVKVHNVCTNYLLPMNC